MAGTIASRRAAPATSEPSVVEIGRRTQRDRLVALDAARGLAIVVMLLAMHPGPNQHDLYHLRHPDWHGLTFADLFFPLFLFAIGVSMTLSPRSAELRHVLRRAAVLMVLGIGLATLKHERFALTGVLQHIAGAYLLAFAILRAPRRWHVPLAAGLVAVTWLAFVVYAWPDDPWGRSGTLAHAVDGAVLGGFTSEGVLQTVISTVAVIGGTVAGHLIRELPDRRRLVRALAVRAGSLIALALVMSLLVPINKRLWTPSFAVLTVGTSFAWLALGVRLVDVAGRRRLVAPLVHLGTNPIAVYVVFMAALALLDNHARSWFPAVAPLGSLTLGSTLYAVAWTALGCLFAYELFRRRILVKL
jgi:predicted acyltransferase